MHRNNDFCLGNDGGGNVSLGDILSFFTGSDVICPLGYETATLNFTEDSDYPTASTCGIELYLPINHCNFSNFSSHMTCGIKDHGGFGLA